MVYDGTPRRPVEPDPIIALAKKIDDINTKVDGLAKGSDLRNASISGGDGLTVKDGSGNIRLKISTTDAAIIAYDAGGTETARYGLLSHSDPGQYGLEVYSGSWIHIGAQVASWSTLAGKPATFPPSAHTHVGADITSGTVPQASQADGSQYGWTNTVAGTTLYALWVGNDGGYHFGRNTSSIRYKENVRPFVDPDPSAGLESLRIVTYDRKGQWKPATDDKGDPIPGADPVLVEGVKNEFGMIAEEVHKVWPEVVTMFDHDDGQGPQIDGLRYDLIGPRLIPIIQAQAEQIRQLRARLDKLDGGVS